MAATILMIINKAAFPQLIKMEDRWMKYGGGLHSTGVAYLLLTQQFRVLLSTFPGIIS